RPTTVRVDDVLMHEAQVGVETSRYYDSFQRQAERIKNDFLRFLLNASDQQEVVAAYGAAAKGNTLMNFARVRAGLIQYVVDANPAKQGKFMPGSRIPIVPESALRRSRPKYVVIFPWNLRREVVDQIGYIRDWGGSFVTAVPRLAVGT